MTLPRFRRWLHWSLLGAVAALLFSYYLGREPPGLSRSEFSRPPVPAPSPRMPEPSLRLVFGADFNPPRPPRRADPAAPEARWDAALGGLSGLYYDPRVSLLYAVSDDPRRFPARLYAFSVELSDTQLRLTPKSVIRLHEREPSGLLSELDAESISGQSGGGFWIGSENGDDRPSQRQPRIFQLDRAGLVGPELALPAAYLPESLGTPTRGPRTNLAFEGLALSPNGRWLSAATESALRQDGPYATFDHGTIVRLLRWDLSLPGAPSEFRYETEPVPRPRSGEPTNLLNGVSELLSLDDQRLLILERSYVALSEGPAVNTVRIFEISLPTGAPAVAGINPAAPPPLIAKRLVLDLDDIVGQLAAGQQRLDNFEGMTVGPNFPSGAPSLLLVTDDNFSDKQRTVFLALRMESPR